MEFMTPWVCSRRVSSKSRSALSSVSLRHLYIDRSSVPPSLLREPLVPGRSPGHIPRWLSSNLYDLEPCSLYASRKLRTNQLRWQLRSVAGTPKHWYTIFLIVGPLTTSTLRITMSFLMRPNEAIGGWISLIHGY